MITIVELILLGTVLFFIAYPLMKKETDSGGEVELEESELSDLRYNKDAAYIALRDLEFDYKTGKIDDEDYREMKGRFEADAMASLKEIEDYKKGEWAPKAVKQALFCPKCGVKALDAHKFCTQCGTAL